MYFAFSVLFHFVYCIFVSLVYCIVMLLFWCSDSHFSFVWNSSISPYFRFFFFLFPYCLASVQFFLSLSSFLRNFCLIKKPENFYLIKFEDLTVLLRFLGIWKSWNFMGIIRAALLWFSNLPLLFPIFALHIQICV